MANYNISTKSSVTISRNSRLIVPMTSARILRDPRLTDTVSTVPTTGQIWPRQKAQS